MSSLEPGTIVAGRYRLERALAQGGMGCVWVARHLQLDVDVAIKFMTPQFAASPEARARFEREARASAALKLANAVQVTDYGVEDGAPYLVMELLEGEDLETRLTRQGRLTLPVTFGIVDQACRALRRAHEVGLVHRDLKPGNIFLARQGGEEVVKVLDFGIAKDTQAAFGGGVTGTGALLGSPHYMSPEQVRSSTRVDHRTDLWALGVIAFRCLTGQLPFPGDEIGEVLVDVCTKPIPRASQIAPELGPDVDRFFERALTRDPAGRFQSADELVDALGKGAVEPVLGAASRPDYGPGAASRPGHAGPASPAAPVVVAAPVESTLSPSAQTRNDTARRSSGRRAAAILLVSVGTVGVASIAAAFFLLSGRGIATPVRPDPTTAPSATPASSPSAVPVPLPEAVPSASAPSDPASSASAPRTPRGRPPVKSGPSRKAPGSPRKSDDLLDHI